MPVPAANSCVWRVTVHLRVHVWAVCLDDEKAMLLSVGLT